jgi:hypothetical protein|tara:strand:- start:1993 stop:2463 length:471 start_codon:yes stop_codon:yes gene_type:complete
MTIKQRFFIIAIVCIPVMLLPAFACDLHGSGGYGFSPFGPRFSMLDRNEMDRNQHTPEKLSITHDRFLFVPNGSTSVLAISYQVPNSFINVKLQFSSDKDIDLFEDSEVILTKSSGIYKLHFAPKGIGDQHIKVHITGLSDTSSVDEERHITVRSI